MAAGKAIDLHALHRQLWKNADRFGRVRVHQKDLSDEMGIAFETMSRVIRRMIADGRILKKVKSHKYNVATYLLADPANFKKN